MPDTTPRPYSPTEERIARPLIKAMSKANAWLYRISGGKMGNTWLHGAPVMLLTTIGRKSGQPRTAPLLYLRDEDKVVIVASKGGMSQHPLWFRNLEANPDCEIQIGGEVTKMSSRRASDEEKASYWPGLTKMYPDFDDYQARTTRNIPVVILSPRQA